MESSSYPNSLKPSWSLSAAPTHHQILNSTSKNYIKFSQQLVHAVNWAGILQIRDSQNWKTRACTEVYRSIWGRPDMKTSSESDKISKTKTLPEKSKAKRKKSSKLGEYKHFFQTNNWKTKVK